MQRILDPVFIISPPRCDAVGSYLFFFFISSAALKIWTSRSDFLQRSHHEFGLESSVSSISRVCSTPLDEESPKKYTAYGT